jgi:hypothetical protein
MWGLQHNNKVNRIQSLNGTIPCSYGETCKEQIIFDTLP